MSSNNTYRHDTADLFPTKVGSHLKCLTRTNMVRNDSQTGGCTETRP